MARVFTAARQFRTSLRTTPEALLQLVRNRLTIEGWHGSAAPSSTRTRTAVSQQWRRLDGHAAHPDPVVAVGKRPYLLTLAGFGSIRAGLLALMHDMRGLVAMAGRQPESDHC